MADGLTVRRVADAKPADKPYELRDKEINGLLLRVQPSGAKSYVLVWDRGRRKTIGRHPVMTLAVARVQARKALVEADQHGAPLAVLSRAEAKAHTLATFIDDEYRSWAKANLKWGDGAADRILSVFADLAGRKLDKIDALTVERWRSKRRADGVSANTCNRDLATLKSALSRARRWGMLDSDPLAEVKQARVDSTRVRYLTKPEEKRLRGALSARDAKGRAARASANAWRTERGRDVLASFGREDYSDHLTPAVLVSMNTGLRRGELTALDWSDVNLPAKMLVVRAAAAKSGKARHVPLNAEAVAVLKRWKRQTGGKGRAFPFHDLKTAWGALLGAAKIEGFRWHDLRHTFASKLVMAGVDLNTVRELLGHGDIKMTLRYAHLAPEKLASAVALLMG